MGFQFDVMFTDSFMDDVTDVKDVEVCVERVICYIPVTETETKKTFMFL
jgi:hypothetical protein